MSKAKFVTGSPMRHILVMTSTASIGMMALFLVDLVDIYFLSLLQKVEITAGVGFAGTLIYFTMSISIGIAITMGAMTSKAIGGKRWRRARRHTSNVLAYGLMTSASFALCLYIFRVELLSLMGAKGAALEQALLYLNIVLPSMPIMTLAMAMSGILRAIGDAKRAMMLTLIGAIVNAILDPIFIFYLEMDIEGAAWATVLGRGSIFLTGFYGAYVVHKLIGRFRLKSFLVDLKPILTISIPTILTNLATPFAGAYVTMVLAQYGDQVVAGVSIIGRLQPVVYCGIFALSGAVGPILGQNWGAKQKDRVIQTYKDSMKFTLYYVLIAGVLLLFSANLIVDIFHAEGESAEIIVFFCTWLTWSLIFAGGQFVANASFNNLGKPTYSTLFNVGKATIGTIPFTLVGADMAGALGAITGSSIGAVIFGTAAVWVGYRHVHKIAV